MPASLCTFFSNSFATNWVQLSQAYSRMGCMKEQYIICNDFRSSLNNASVLFPEYTRVVQKVLSIIGFLGFIPGIF